MDSEGAVRILAERHRQIDEEGWTAEHDDEHQFGEIAGAAVSYADAAKQQIAAEPLKLAGEHIRPNQAWRWSHERWKPSDDPVRNLEKAGALCAAEIDRILREREADALARAEGRLVEDA